MNTTLVCDDFKSSEQGLMYCSNSAGRLYQKPQEYGGARSSDPSDSVPHKISVTSPASAHSTRSNCFDRNDDVSSACEEDNDCMHLLDERMGNLRNRGWVFDMVVVHKTTK